MKKVSLLLVGLVAMMLTLGAASALADKTVLNY